MEAIQQILLLLLGMWVFAMVLCFNCISKKWCLLCCRSPCNASDNSLSTSQCSALSLAPPFRYLTTVIGTPIEGSQKVVRFVLLFWKQLLTIEMEITAYHTVLYCTAPQWKLPIIVPFSCRLGIENLSICNCLFPRHL